MGAWGHGSFENDTALDWVSELTERRGFFVFKKAGGFSVLEKALEVVPDTPLDADAGSEALAAAEVIAALMGKGRDCLPKELAEWVSNAQPVDVEPLRTKALKALDAVLSEDSELRELWEESEDFEAWKSDVEGLRSLLKS